MKILYPIALGLLMIFTMSCNRQANLGNDELIAFAYLEPISLIYEIDKKGIPQYDESLSQTNRDLVQMAISNYAVTKIDFSNDSLRLDALSDLDYTMMQFLDGIPIEEIDIPVGLRTTLIDSDVPYTVGLLSDGFQLSKKRYLREIGLSILVTAASNGNQIRTPMKQANFLYCAVFDNQDGTLLGFIPIESTYKDPVKPEAISRQVKTLSKQLRKRRVQKMIIRRYRN